MPIEFWILCLVLVAFFGGWVAKIAWEQYKADCEREARAEERRQFYELKKELWKNNFDESERLFEPDLSVIRKAVAERNAQFKGGAVK